jgi:hypothetical protein
MVDPQTGQVKEQHLTLTPTADGKMTVSGLLPGQQIVRTIDGVFHLVSPVDGGQSGAQSLPQAMPGGERDAFDELMAGHNQQQQGVNPHAHHQQAGTLLVS